VLELHIYFFILWDQLLRIFLEIIFPFIFLLAQKNNSKKAKKGHFLQGVWSFAPIGGPFLNFLQGFENS